jgi:MerR family transcriptional regulator, copper efflux regulator
MLEESKPKRLQVGEFAKTIGKTVRALHLYEELGLLHPVGRSKGGFRLYDEASVERARWIVKLQGIGFTLAQIQGFVADFESAQSGHAATNQARETFRSKLDELRTQIDKLKSSEKDLMDALGYLEGCVTCEVEFSPANCHDCNLNGHAPELFAGLSESASNYVNAGSLNRSHRDDTGKTKPTATLESSSVPECQPDTNEKDARTGDRRSKDDQQAPVA